MDKKAKVLVVDHEPKRLQDTARTLQTAGYEVLGAATGDECLRTARAKQPDLILVNAALPDISGIDLARQIKRDPQLVRAYVVLLSAEETPSAIQARGLESGADGYLVRTISSREFLARVEAMLRRQRTEEELRVSVQEWRAVFDAISDAAYLVDLEGKILHCNLAMAKFLGKPPSQIIGSRCYELVHGAAERIPGCLIECVRETQRRETLVVPMEDRWLQVAVDPLLDESGNLIGAVHILSDITERRQAEEALQKAREELEAKVAEVTTALEGANQRLELEVAERQRAEEALAQAQAKWERQAEGFRAALAQAEAALQAGVAERQRTEEALGQAKAELERQAEEQRAALAQAEAALQAEVAERQRVEEALRQAKAELERQAEEQRAALAQAEAALQAEVAERQRVEEALRQAKAELEKQAEEQRAALAQAEAALQAEVAERQRVEEALHQSEERWQAQKMEAVEHLAAGIAQDFNQLLTIILGNVELGLAQLKPSYPLHSELEAIQKTARRAVALTRQLLALSRQQVLQLQALNLNQLITGFSETLQRLIGERIHLELGLTPEFKLVHADPNSLEQVLMNLALNARDAMPQGGALHIETALVTLDEAYCRSHPQAQAGEYVRLVVADTGMGIDEKIRERLFEPFFVPREAEKRRGLDLAVVYGIVKQHGGLIEVSSQDGGGTRFEIYLPVAEKSAD